MNRLTPVNKQRILDLARQHGVASVRVFGSVARGDAGPTSDLDLLIRFEAPSTLIKVIGFKQAVEEALRLKVDVVEEGGISPFLQERILGEAIGL